MANKNITPEDAEKKLSKIKQEREEEIKTGQQKPSTVDDVNARLEQARQEKLAQEQERRLALEDEAGERVDEDEDNNDDSNNYDNKDDKNSKEKKENDQNENKDEADNETKGEEGETKNKKENQSKNDIKDEAQKAEKKLAENAEKKAVNEVEKKVVEQAAKQVAEKAAVSAASAVGWPVILTVLGVLAVAIIFLILAVAIFAIFSRGSVGNSFAQPMSKTDPVRVEFVNKYLGDNPEKSPDNAKIPKLQISTRDKEFLKNGGTHSDPSIQPDQRVIEVLNFLLEGNEESRKNGFSGFSHVNVSYIVSMYEDMPINREQVIKPGLTDSISAHQKGQALDISALGMVKQKCKCGEMVPVMLTWQDDPPQQEQSAQAQTTQNITNTSQETNEVGTSFGKLSNSVLENELNVPQGTLAQANLQNMAQYAALGGFAEGLGLPSNVFMPNDPTEQAKIALNSKIGEQLGIKIDNTKLTGNKDIDSYLYKISKNYIFDQLGMNTLTSKSDSLPSNQQDKAPILSATDALERGLEIDTSILNYDKKNVTEMLTSAGGAAFAEQFNTRAQILANGLNWFEMAKKAVTKTIEEKGNLPDGAISENKTELAVTGSDGNFDSENNQNIPTPKTPFWQNDKVVNFISAQMNLDGNDPESIQQKDYLKRVLKDPGDEDALVALARTQGTKYLDKAYQLPDGSSQRILSLVEGTAKNEAGTTLDLNDRIRETTTILANNKAFTNLEKQYKLPEGSVAKYLNSDNHDEREQMLVDIGIQRLAGQFQIDPKLFSTIVSSVRQIKSVSIIGLPQITIPNPELQLTNALNNSPAVAKYLENYGLKSEQLSQFILGDDQKKLEIGKQFAIKVGAKQLGLNPEDTSTFGNLASGVIGKKIGIPAGQLDGLYTMWFPSQAQKDAFNSLTTEEKDAFRNARGEATQNALIQSGLIQSKLSSLGVPTTFLQDYFEAPSSRTDEKISKADVLYRDLGPVLDKKLNAPEGTVSKIGEIINNPIYDQDDKVMLVSTELLKSYSATQFENSNALPYKAFASVLAGNTPEQAMQQQFNVGMNIINTKLGLDFFDQNDENLANWDPNDKSKENEANKRYSIQNALNGKIPMQDVLARSSFVKVFEQNNKLPEGSVASILDSEKDSKARQDQLNKIGGSYLDSSFQITLSDEEKAKYPEGFTMAVLKGEVSSDAFFDKAIEQQVMKNILTDYGIQENTIPMMKVLITGNFLDSDATAGQKQFAAKMVAGDVMGTMLGNKLGFTSKEDMDMARSAVKQATLGHYTELREVGYAYGLNQLDGAAGLPTGTLRTVYDGYSKGDWSGFENVGAGALDQVAGLPPGSSMALKNGFADGNWTAANAMVGSYIGGQIDKAIGAPPGSSYGAYMWIATGNPVMFALAVAGPAVFDAIGKLPLIGGVFGGGLLGGIGLGGCKGNTDCYKDIARTNVHTAIEQLLRAPAEYGLENNRVNQLITYNHERDVQPFIDNGLVEKAYGWDHSTVYGLFAMKEAYQQMHLGF